jgi:hypothetical protein
MWSYLSILECSNADYSLSCIDDSTFECSGLLAVLFVEGTVMSADAITSEKSFQLLFFLGHHVSHIVVMGAQHSTKE